MEEQNNDMHPLAAGYESTITYPPAKAREILKSAELRRGQPRTGWGQTYIGPAEILVGGVWMSLVRTDLKDDVCTSYQGEGSLDLEEYREIYLKRIQFGVRVTPAEGASTASFACIDAFSDG